MIAALLLLAATPAANDCVSGIDMELSVCFSEKGEKADAELNEVWREAKAKAQADDEEFNKGGGTSRRPTPSSFKDLLAAQRAWLKFRDAQCALESDGADGGSLQPVLYGQCYLRMTEERIRLLQHILEV